MTLITTLLNAPPNPVQPTVASDMEGTLSTGVTWKGMRDYLLTHGRKREFKRFLRARLLKIPLYQLNLVDRDRFRVNWMRDLILLFEGMSREEFGEAADFVVEQELWPNRRQSVIDALHAHQAAGRRVIVVSGLLEPMLARFLSKIGLEGIGTPIQFKDEVFTGRLAGDFTVGNEKVAQMRHFLPDEGRLYAGYGDTPADIPLLEMSEHPFAVGPDKSLNKHAEKIGWETMQ